MPQSHEIEDDYAQSTMPILRKRLAQAGVRLACLLKQAGEIIGGYSMAQADKQSPVTMQGLLVSTLAQSGALAKLLIEKGVISQAEFLEKLLQERAVYQRMLNPTVQ